MMSFLNIAQEKLQQKLEKQEMLQAAKHAKKERGKILKVPVRTYFV